MSPSEISGASLDKPMLWKMNNSRRCVRCNAQKTGCADRRNRRGNESISVQKTYFFFVFYTKNPV